MIAYANLRYNTLLGHRESCLACACFIYIIIDQQTSLQDSLCTLPFATFLNNFSELHKNLQDTCYVRDYSSRPRTAFICKHIYMYDSAIVCVCSTVYVMVARLNVFVCLCLYVCLYVCVRTRACVVRVS